MRPRILFLVPSDYDELIEKGISPVQREREEGGLFDRIITVHPSARHARILDLTPTHRLIEFHEDIPAFCLRHRWLRYPVHTLYFLSLLRRLGKIIKDEKILLIRANDPAFTGLLAWMLARLHRLPFCVSIHADYNKRFELDPAKGAQTLFGSRRLGRALEGFVLRRADRVLPIRTTLAESAQRLGVPAGRVRVIPHGIDMGPFQRTSNFSIRKQLGLSETAKILSFAGRLSKENYVYDLISLAEELRKRRSDFVIVLAGDGPERMALDRLVASRDLSNSVTLVGSLRSDPLVALRLESTLSLCLMGGYSLIEACAAGHPVIAYDVEWHSELVKTGETGSLVPEHDVPALVEAVCYLLDHPEELHRQGDKARDLVLARHDIQKTSQLKRQYYLELLGLKPILR